MIFGDYPHVVNREAGPQTCAGAGDIVIDSYGQRWRVVSGAEADMLRIGTANNVATIHSDGTSRR